MKKRKYTTPSVIATEEEKIFKEEKKIEAKEAELISLDTEVKKLVKKDISIDKEEEKLEERDQTFIQRLALNKVKDHKLLLVLIVFVGGGLAWKGLWALLDSIPVFDYSLVSLFAGLALLWLFNKLKDL